MKQVEEARKYTRYQCSRRHWQNGYLIGIAGQFYKTLPGAFKKKTRTHLQTRPFNFALNARRISLSMQIDSFVEIGSYLCKN